MQVHRRAAHERRDERVGRAVVDVVGGADLLHFAVGHHAQPVAERHRLDLVVGDVDRRDGQFAVQPLQVAADLVAQLRVEIRQRLVEQERLRLAHQRAAHRDPLTLTAGELAGLAVEQLVDLQQLGRLADPPVDLGARRPALPQPVGQVAVHRHVRIQRVVLEHHRDVALAGRQAVDHRAADPDLARRRLVQPGQQSQRGALAAPRRPDEDQELAVGHRQVEALRATTSPGVTPRDVTELDFRQRISPSQPFSPVLATDCTKYRCAPMNTSSIGSRLITLAAISSGHFTRCAP